MGREPGTPEDDGTRPAAGLGRVDVGGRDAPLEGDVEGRVPLVVGLEELEGAGRLPELGAGRGRGDAAGCGRGFGEGRGAARGLGLGEGLGVDRGLELDDAAADAGCTRLVEAPGRSAASAGTPEIRITNNSDDHIRPPKPKYLLAPLDEPLDTIFDIFYENRNGCVTIGLLAVQPTMIQPPYCRCIPALLLALLSGCADSGTLWIDGRAERLRTMLVRADSTENATRATVVLSNGLFDCTLPELDDPARAQQAVQNMITAACREGAVHLNLTLWRTPEGGWTGTYPGLSYGGPLDLGPQQTRLSDAVYYSVEEAILVEYVNLDRAYAVESAVLEEGAGDGGQVDIVEEESGLSGGLSMPSLGLAGDFQAQWCEADDNQFALLESSPAFVCP